MKKSDDVINQQEEKKLPSSRFNIILEKQEIVQLTTVPGAKSSYNLIWESGDEEIATVTNIGKVTAINVGRTQIYVENETLTFEDLINVKVVGKGEAKELRLAIQLNISEVSRLSLEDAEHPVWESLDSSVAMISETGEVTAISEGIALITATCGDEVNVIYVIVKGRGIRDLDLTNIDHFERIRNIVISNAGKVTLPNAITFGSVESGADMWSGGVVGEDGKVYRIPMNATSVSELNLETLETTKFGDLGSDTSKWRGGVLANNKKIYGIPNNATSILEIDTHNKTVTTFSNVGTDSNKWRGGVLAPNGKIYGIPSNSTAVLEIDPDTKERTFFGSVGSSSNKWSGGVLALNGKIYGIPSNSTAVLEIDPDTKTVITFGSVGSSNSWSGGVLAPNGKIYCMPNNTSSILEIDPETRTATTFTGGGNNNSWSGGVLAPNGKIYGIPNGASSILEIDPETRTAMRFGSVGSSSEKWIGGVLAPNGKIYGIPGRSPLMLELDLVQELINFDFKSQISAWVNKC